MLFILLRGLWSSCRKARREDFECIQNIHEDFAVLFKLRQGFAVAASSPFRYPGISLERFCAGVWRCWAPALPQVLSTVRARLRMLWVQVSSGGSSPTPANLLTTSFPVEGTMPTAWHYYSCEYFPWSLEQARYCENICGEYLVVFLHVSTSGCIHGPFVCYSWIF